MKFRNSLLLIRISSGCIYHNPSSYLSRNCKLGIQRKWWTKWRHFYLRFDNDFIIQAAFVLKKFKNTFFVDIVTDIGRKTKVRILYALMKNSVNRKQTSNQHRWIMEKTLNLRVHKRSFNENSNLSEILQWQWIYCIHIMLKMPCVCVWNTFYATIIVLPNVNIVFPCIFH